MTSETLSDIALVTPGTSPKGELINSEGKGYPFFQGSKEFQALYPRAERFTEFPVKVARKDDILISVRAPVGQVNIAPQDVAIGRGVMSVRPKQDSDRYFVFYLLKWLEGRWDSLGSTGSVFENLSVSALSSVEIPKVEHRETIGRVLFQIDCKIQENSRISKTLEEIAQAIFKSWFIDFDPVKAKIAGEKPVGIDDATAALFPDSMKDSELGPIPKGWEVVTIGDVLVKQKPGKLYDQKTSSQSGLIPVLDQGRSGVVGYHNEAPGYFATPDNPVVVFANHTCSLRFIAFPFSVIQNVFPILGNELSVYWLYFALQGKQEFDSYKGHWPDLVIKPVVRPTQIVSKAFENLTSPLMKMVWNLEKENQGLVQLRDSLLPRLISGELQIPEAMLVS